MAVREILKLGNPELYKVSEVIHQEESRNLEMIVQDLHDTMMNFRKEYGAGRAIAAPQIGFKKRLIYMNVSEHIVFVNPRIDQKSEEMMEVWDDCMCFPDLLVKVLRHKSCRIVYQDLQWREKVMHLENDLAELLQHEFDHLDGILAVSKAHGMNPFALTSQKAFLSKESITNLV